MIPVFLRPDADLDIRSAARWYEIEEVGLGSRFTDEVVATFSRIAALPTRFPFVSDRIRRALVRRFPYGVYFVAEPARVVVIGVFHQKRAPTAWLKRARSTGGAG